MVQLTVGRALHAGIIDHGVQVIDVDDAFKFSPHHDGHVAVQGRSELDPQTHVTGLLGIEFGSIRIPAGLVVPHVQSTILVVSPIARLDHGLAMLAHGPTRVQEPSIAFQIFQDIIAGEFQGNVRVLFPSDILLHGRHPFALEGKRVLFLSSIESRAIQDPTIMC